MLYTFKKIEVCCFQNLQNCIKKLDEEAIRKLIISSLWECYFPPIINFGKKKVSIKSHHCVKSVRTRSHSSQYFPAFGLITERYSVSLRIQSEWGKIQTRITPNTDTFHAVHVTALQDFIRNFNGILDEKWSKLLTLTEGATGGFFFDKFNNLFCSIIYIILLQLMNVKKILESLFAAFQQ